MIFASLLSCATPEMIACSIWSPSVSCGASVTQVPSALLNEERTWIGIRYRLAYSTQRSIRTFVPQAAISSISSYEMRGIRVAPGTIRGSAVKTPSTSV